jgi:hypothetical protein
MSREFTFNERRTLVNEAVDRTLKAWRQYDRLLGVGAGKKIIASAVIQARLPEGPAAVRSRSTEYLGWDA